MRGAEVFILSNSFRSVGIWDKMLQRYSLGSTAMPWQESGARSHINWHQHWGNGWETTADQTRFPSRCPDAPSLAAAAPAPCCRPLQVPESC